MKKKIKNYFLAGLLLLLPISLTIYILSLILSLMDGLINLLPQWLQPETYIGFKIPGLGLILTLVVVLLVGVLAKSYLVRKLVEFGEKILGGIPLVRGIYISIKQFAQTVFSENNKNFKRVVLVEYPRKGMYTLAFVTGVSEGEVQQKTRRKVINIFVPTTPNPTSGFYLMVPEDDVIYLEMSVERAFKQIISGGIVTSDSIFQDEF